MPLPENSTLSVFGPSRPGDPIPSKPKKAILVRLSSEILDALEAPDLPLPQVKFEASENPGLYIGDACFPMAYSKETADHEVYLRAASATKKNAPLKLYGNVVGKSTVDQREIRNELPEKIRESTQDAVAQKNSATVFMPTPPETQPASKKRKEAPMFHKPLRPSDKIKATPSVPTSSKATLPLQPPSSHQGGVSVRARMVHCLARSDRPEGELYKLLGAEHNIALRAEIAGLLKQVADVKVERSVKVYKLNPVGWKDVRPFEWPGLSEQERIQFARTGRLNLYRNLYIPKSDPIWDHFEYRSSVLDHFAAPTDPKRGVSSRELKEKKTKKGDPNAEIQIKDESKGALKRPTTGAVSEARRTLVDATRVTSSTLPQPSGQAKPIIRREIKELPSSSNSKPILAKKKIVEDVPNQITRKSLVEDDSSRGSLKRKQMEDADVNPRSLKRCAIEEDSAQKSSKVKVRDDNKYTGSTSRASSKRKADDDDNELVRKKRLRPDWDPSTKSSSRDDKGRKESVPTKKTTTVSRTDHASVATHMTGEKRAEPHRSATRSASRKPTKLRRKTPIYTSSEDEDGPPVKTDAPTTTSKGQTARSSTSHPLPSNDNLRAKYNAKYLEYLSVLTKLVQQQGRLESLLAKCDSDGSESVSEDEGDVELLLFEELELLTMKHKQLHAELQAIRDEFDRRNQKAS